MKPQYTNKLISSFLLYLDNLLLKKGEAFAYASPFSQMVYDQSIPNTIPFSGVYLDNTFITTGQSGLAHIDYRKGTVYFTSEIQGNNRISGNFSVCEFNTQLTNHPEYRLLFETKKTLKPKFNQKTTGIAPNEIIFPVIFVKDNGGWAEQFALGGEDLTINRFRLIVLSDSQFNGDAIASLLKDQTNSFIPLMFTEEFPFTPYGSLKQGSYNYTGIVGDRVSHGSGVFIEKVQPASMTDGFRGDLNNLQSAIFPSIIDVTVSMPRFTR